METFWQEIKSIYRFYCLSPHKREIVFYAEDIASYTYFEGLIEHLTHVENLPVCYFTSDSSDPLLSANKENLHTFYINSLLPFFTISLTSTLLIMTMPDLHRFYIKRSVLGAHHVYLFHNIGSSFPVIRFGALFHYDTIFCVGPHHIEEIRRQEELYHLSKKNLVRFGYYRLEKVFRDCQQYVHSENQVSPYKGRVLIGPSWGADSILNICGSRLIRVLLDANYEVIVRPHPMTRKLDSELLDGLNNEFNSFENYIFEEDISSVESIFTSDVLISDWSGFTFEYAFGTERPVLFIDVPRKIVNPQWHELGIEPIDVGIRTRIGEVLGVDELEKADALISRLMTCKDTYVQEIVKARAELVYNFGNSSQAGAECIRDLLLKKTIEEE